MQQQIELLQKLYEKQITETQSSQNVHNEPQHSISDEQSTDFGSSSARSRQSSSRVNQSDLNFGDCANILLDIAKYFNMDKRTVHYAINYLDTLLYEGISLKSPKYSFYRPKQESMTVFQCMFEQEKKQTQVEENTVACVCVMLASKFNDCDYIGTRELLDYLKDKYITIFLYKKDLLNFEIDALQTLQTYLFKVLPIDFLDCFDGVESTTKYVYDDDIIHQNFVMIHYGGQEIDDSDVKVNSNPTFSRKRHSQHQKSKIAKSGAQVDQLQRSKRIMIEAKVEEHIKKLSDLVMKNYDMFRDYLCSDIALAIVFCARILAGIQNEKQTYQFLLQKLAFEKWSKMKVKQRMSDITKGVIKKILAIVTENEILFFNHEYQALKTAIDIFQKKPVEQKGNNLKLPLRPPSTKMLRNKEKHNSRNQASFMQKSYDIQNKGLKKVKTVIFDIENLESSSDETRSQNSPAETKKTQQYSSIDFYKTSISPPKTMKNANQRSLSSFGKVLIPSNKHATRQNSKDNSIGFVFNNTKPSHSLICDTSKYKPKGPHFQTFVQSLGNTDRNKTKKSQLSLRNEIDSKRKLYQTQNTTLVRQMGNAIKKSQAMNQHMAKVRSNSGSEPNKPAQSQQDTDQKVVQNCPLRMKNSKTSLTLPQYPQGQGYQAINSVKDSMTQMQTADRSSGNQSAQKQHQGADLCQHTHTSKLHEKRKMFRQYSKLYQDKSFSQSPTKFTTKSPNKLNRNAFLQKPLAFAIKVAPTPSKSAISPVVSMRPVSPAAPAPVTVPAPVPSQAPEPVRVPASTTGALLKTLPPQTSLTLKERIRLQELQIGSELGILTEIRQNKWKTLLKLTNEIQEYKKNPIVNGTRGALIKHEYVAVQPRGTQDQKIGHDKEYHVLDRVDAIHFWPRYCTQCGEKFISETMRFCGECGGQRDN